MKLIRFLLIALTALTLAISGEALAKKTKDKPKKEHKISQSREINANKQSKSEENVRGQERAEERHELKQNNGRGYGSSTRGPRQPRN